jgi:hypothetical protein
LKSMWWTVQKNMQMFLMPLSIFFLNRFRSTSARINVKFVNCSLTCNGG